MDTGYKEKELRNTMKIIVISSCDVLREGIVAIVSRHQDISVYFAGETVKEAMLLIKGSMADVIVIDIHKDNEEELNVLGDISSLGLNIKMMVLDFHDRNELFLKALKSGVQGYVSGKSNEEEIMYAMNQVYSGKKYFGSNFIDYMVGEFGDLLN